MNDKNLINLQKILQETSLKCCSKIARVLKTFEFGNSLGVIFESLSSFTLEGLIEQANTLSFSNSIEIALTAIESINIFHNLGITFNGISMSNIYFTKNGKTKFFPSFEAMINSFNMNVLEKENSKFIDLKSIIIILINCIFGENWSYKDINLIISNLHFLQRINKNNINLKFEKYLGCNQTAIFIALKLKSGLFDKLKDFLLSENINTNMIKEIVKVMKTSDPIHFCPVTLSDLIRTLKSFEIKNMIEEQKSDFTISTQFSKDILKKLIKDLIDHFKESELKTIDKNQRFEFKNWLLINDNSLVIKELAESLGLNRTIVFKYFRGSIERAGIPQLIKLDKDKQKLK